MLEQCPKEMKEYAVRWGKLILPQLVHGAIKIRERAMEEVQMELPTLIDKKELSSWLSGEYKTVSVEMKDVMTLSI